MPRLPRSILHLSALLTLAATTTAQTEEIPQQVFDRAIADFQGGRVVQAATGFDHLVKLVPALKPQLWQRGIALYYAGRYRDCRDQFESHRTVNPNDVENAAWHFLCVARADSPEKARAALLPVGPDARVPMAQIYEMFRGKLSPQEVLASAGDQLVSQFYARLYLGLYFEALGNDRGARENIQVAAAARFSSAGGFMHTVAKVHSSLLQRQN